MKNPARTQSTLSLILITSLTTLWLACGDESAQDPLESNKVRVQRVYEEAYNGGNLAVIDELIAENYVNHQYFPGVPPDREGLKQVIGAMRTGFPDLNIIISDMRAEGDTVYVRATITGTHLGNLTGIEPTGKKVAFETIDVFRLVDGKQVDHWGVTDQLGLMMQLGVMSGG